MAARRGSWSLTCTCGRAPSGSALCACSTMISRVSGRASGTTTTATRGASSATGATDRRALATIWVSSSPDSGNDDAQIGRWERRHPDDDRELVSPAWGTVDLAVSDGVDELGVVLLVLEGVGLRKADHGRVEGSPLAEVGADGRRVAGGGVGASEDHSALTSELAQPRCHLLTRRDDLHVAELADVEVDARRGGPADEDVGRALDE